MRGWHEFLIKNPGSVADSLHGVAGKTSKQGLLDKLDEKGLRTLRVGKKTVRFNKRDLGKSSSLAEYLIRRASLRSPIRKSASWGEGPIFFSLTAHASETMYSDLINGEISVYSRDKGSNIISYFKQGGLESSRTKLDTTLNIDSRILNDLFQASVENYVENSWGSTQTSMLEIEELPMPRLNHDDLATGDYAPHTTSVYEGFSELVEVLKNYQERIMEERPGVWRVSASAYAGVTEKIITSNHHSSPARKVIPQCVIHSEFKNRVDHDVLPAGSTVFFHSGVMGTPKKMLDYLDREGEREFVGKAVRLFDEREDMQPMNKHSNRIVRTILSPSVAGLLGHELCHEAECDDSLNNGGDVSLWEKGKRILSDNVSLWDDPTREDLYGYSPFDDLGIISLKKKLVDEGVINDQLYGFDSAGLKGEEVDGHIFGSYVRMTNTVWEPVSDGPKDLDEMIEASRGEHPIIVIDGGLGGVNFNYFNLIGLEVTRSYLIPEKGSWTERIPLGFPKKPGKASTMQVDDHGFKSINAIVGSENRDEGVCDFGFCGKGDYFSYESKPVGQSAPYVSMVVKILSGEEGRSYKPPLIPVF